MITGYPQRHLINVKDGIKIMIRTLLNQKAAENWNAGATQY